VLRFAGAPRFSEELDEPRRYGLARVLQFEVGRRSAVAAGE
jgi:hypothetical protein